MAGRRPNLPRSEARERGDKTYSDPGNPCLCGEDVRYVSNAQCVACMIDKGRARYASLTDEQKAAHAERDRRRYLKRVGREDEI